MGFSVAGRLLERLVITMRLDSSLLVVLSGLLMAALSTERLSPMALLWATPLAIIANWTVCSAHENFRNLVGGVEAEPASSLKYGRVQSSPRFDPARGYVVDVSYDGHVIPVVLDFTTTTALSLPRKVYNEVDMEASRGGLPPSSISVEDAPPCVVVLYSGTTRLGMGTRIRTPTGRDLLMTNHHIAIMEPDGIAHKGRFMKVDLGKPCIACDHQYIDCAFYEVPPKVWSLLGVKSAPLKPMVKQTPVTLFGGSSSTDFSSCVGIAHIGENPFLIRHQSTTCSGWSGSPLYHKGAVVGLHIGATNGANVASNVAWYFHTFKREVVVESPFEIYGRFRETTQEEMENNAREGVVYEEYDFSGDTIKVSSKDWLRKRTAELAASKPKHDRWSDWPSDDDVDAECLVKSVKKRFKKEVFMDAMSDMSDDYRSTTSGETVVPESGVFHDVPLNFQGAGSTLRGSPPLDGLSGSGITSGTPSGTQSPPKACPSPTLENRLCHLENMLGKLLTQQSKTQSQYSQILKDLAGLREDRKPSSAPSSSRPADSKERYVPPASRRQSSNSKSGTQGSPLGNASKGNGDSKTSTKKSNGSSAKPAK